MKLNLSSDNDFKSSVLEKKFSVKTSFENNIINISSNKFKRIIFKYLNFSPRAKITDFQGLTSV